MILRHTDCFVSGPLHFIVDDPGRQTIGSFHPITTGEWSEGAYLDNGFGELMNKTKEGDNEAIRALLANGMGVDTTDVLGRTALHVCFRSLFDFRWLFCATTRQLLEYFYPCKLIHRTIWQMVEMWCILQQNMDLQQ